MQRKHEFSDLNKAGQMAVGAAHVEALHIFQQWGFQCGLTPFSDPGLEASNALQQALVDFLIATNQPDRTHINERP